MENLFWIKLLFAFSPIAVVLILMLGLKWSGGRAGAAGWFTAVIVSVVFFGSDATLLAYAQAKGILLSIYVLYIVWMALFLYNVVQETGAIETIGNGIRKLTTNRALQLLILAWVFSSFLQGVAGFGVPIAVVGPLLMGIGFPAVLSVAAPAIGHSWSVTYGDMASSFQALIAVTGLDGYFLAPWASIFLGLSTFLCGLAVVHLYGGFAAMWQSLPAILIIGTVMAGTQYFLSVTGLWTLAGFMAGMAGIVASILVTRLAAYRYRQEEDVGGSAISSRMSLGTALAAYIILVIFVTVAELYDPIQTLLNQVKLSLYFPEITTRYGWKVAAGYGKKISLFGHAGALLLYPAIISFFFYNVKGYYSPGAVGRIWAKTLKSGVATSIGIISMVCFAMIMDQSGMTYSLAEGASKVFGRFYPFFSPAIGTLGTFMTGSNTNSNVVFGLLQKQTAELAGLSVSVILAAQTAGGSIGSMLAPAKILVGCSTVGLAGKEAPVLGITMKYGLIITGFIGLLALLFQIF